MGVKSRSREVRRLKGISWKIIVDPCMGRCCSRPMCDVYQEGVQRMIIGYFIARLMEGSE